MLTPGSMPSFEEIKEILGFNNYYEEEKLYATNISQVSSERGGRKLIKATETRVTLLFIKHNSLIFFVKLCLA